MMHVRDIRHVLGMIESFREAISMELSERKHVLYDHLNHTREELLEVVGQMQTGGLG